MELVNRSWKLSQKVKGLLISFCIYLQNLQILKGKLLISAKITS